MVWNFRTLSVRHISKDRPVFKLCPVPSMGSNDGKILNKTVGQLWCINRRNFKNSATEAWNNWISSNRRRPRLEPALSRKFYPKSHSLPYFFEYRLLNLYEKNLQAAACIRRNTALLWKLCWKRDRFQQNEHHTQWLPTTDCFVLCFRRAMKPASRGSSPESVNRPSPDTSSSSNPERAPVSPSVSFNAPFFHLAITYFVLCNFNCCHGSISTLLF